MSYLLAICLVSALGGLLFGYDWVVIGGAKPFYEVFFSITKDPIYQGWAMSCALIGCVAGAILSGFLSDLFGRKKLLMISAVLFLFTSLGTGIANSFVTFVIFRICGGIAIGLASNLSPMYISEISPAGIRGKMVSLNQLTIVLGILLAQLVNWLIAKSVPKDASELQIFHSWNGQVGWRWMFWACAVPAFLFFVFMLFIPESPRWLAKRDLKHKAIKVLSRVGGTEYAENEYKNIHETLLGETEKVNFKSLFAPGIGKILVLGVVLAVFQQWCGINTVFYYAQEIFASAGYGVNDILFNIVIEGVTILVFTFVAIFTVDHLGRRVLMLVGAVGLAGIYSVIGIMYYIHIQGVVLLFMVMLAIACYSMTLAPITWVILSEIFPNKIRGTAMSIGTFSLWSACFILTMTFPLIKGAMNISGAFWLYAVICVIGFIFILYRLPETKGKTLEQIENELTK